MDLEFTPVEAKQFEEALLSAFPKRTNLERMVLFRLGQELDQIVPDGNLTDNVFNLILWAASQGQTRALLEAAHEEVPGNAKLHAFYLQIKAPPVTPPQSSASSTIDLARALIGRPLPPSEAIPLLDALGDLEDADQRRVQLRVRLQDGNSFESALSSGLTNGV